MLTLTEDLCREATINGTFSTKLLKTSTPLSYEDLRFLADYIGRTLLIKLELSLEITADNTRALTALSRAIGNQRELIEFKFKVTRNEYHLIPSDNLILSILNYFANKKVRKQNSLVYDAMVQMVRNKPILEKLSINLKEIDNSASKVQSLQLAEHIKKSPLTHLMLHLKVERDALLPILSTKSINNRLVELKLDGLTFGRNIIHYLKQAQGLRVLEINDMLLKRKDFLSLQKIMEANNSLQILHFNATNIGQIDSKVLLQALLLCPSITYLNLAENNLNRANIEALCDYVSHNPANLLELDLTGNAYMADDIKKLALALTFNTKIDKLIIDHNYIEDAGIQLLIELLHINHSITSISMSHNCRFTPSNQTITELCSLLKAKDCRIEELHFEQNTSIEQLKMLTDAIMLNSSLVSVKLNFKSDNILASFYKQQINDHLNGMTPLIMTPASQPHSLGDSAILDRESNLSSIVNCDDSFFNSDDSESENSLNKNGLYLALNKTASTNIK